MNKIKDIFYSTANWLSKLIGIRGDYILHFGVCFLSTFLMGLISFLIVFAILGYNAALIAGLLGAVFSSGLAIGKEAGDKNNPNSGWSWWDLVADGFGIVTGLLVLAILIVMLF